MVNDSGDSITQDFYEISESGISGYHQYTLSYIKIQNVKQIKTITINNIKRTLVLVFIEDNSNSNIYKVKLYKYYFEFMDTHLDLVNNNNGSKHMCLLLPYIRNSILDLNMYKILLLDILCID